MLYSVMPICSDWPGSILNSLSWGFPGELLRSVSEWSGIGSQNPLCSAFSFSHAGLTFDVVIIPDDKNLVRSDSINKLNNSYNEDSFILDVWTVVHNISVVHCLYIFISKWDFNYFISCLKCPGMLSRSTAKNSWSFPLWHVGFIHCTCPIHQSTK